MSKRGDGRSGSKDAGAGGKVTSVRRGLTSSEKTDLTEVFALVSACTDLLLSLWRWCSGNDVQCA
jgi:hypothetical protein